jgi:hypothetical protein
VHGELKLTVDKDTPGKVRARSAGAKSAGIAHIDSIAEGKVIMRVVPISIIEGETFKPTHLMEKVSRYLETIPEGCSGANIEAGVGGKRDYVREAVTALVDAGHVLRETRGNAVWHTLVNPYREDKGSE